jgi:hypothetical protein
MAARGGLNPPETPDGLVARGAIHPFLQRRAHSLVTCANVAALRFRHE